MRGKRPQQSYLGAVPRLPAPEPIKEIMLIDTNTRQDDKWFELMKLAHRCPSTVNGITIMGPTRLTLWCLACHADSETASTTVNSYTLTKEVGCSYDTLDRALQDLILAGLVSQSGRFVPRGQAKAAIRGHLKTGHREKS
jgi:hypothetical protein